MKPKPIVIPKEIANDRGVHRLITSWAHLHHRHAVCSQRVNWRNARAAKEEKRRRREKWRIVARILEIERNLLRMVAKETRHPDIWMSKKFDAPESTRQILLRKYYANCRATHNLRGKDREKFMRWREKRVADLRALDRAWMLAIFDAVNPGRRPPRALNLHPRELVPRKLKRASRELVQELAA